MFNLIPIILYLTGTLATPTSSHPSNSAPHLEKSHARPIETYTAREVITKLNLTANPEGGYLVQSFEDPLKSSNRSVSTAIYYLLEGSTGDSLWHKVDAAEVWHYYAGAPLTLSLSWDNGTATRYACLGQEIFEGQRPQVVVGRDEWQRARSEGEWTLVGTTVAPGFTESGTVIREAGWEPWGA
ncbi:hypothetical protein CLAFUW4_10855 [Fulvia fulva]|uniref:DUF985 domain-containing protein n=1 Tax=Passalora fulva TaxID=5499 RepID=A0A9Q8US15_PASFU|nr:uncharacterized protein CLAFUR5_09897 [Fulvia fulva]KAK4619395.1 hypothetical protein CLAFUR4_10860 [Fulvia fulva]KAK4620815.1 hypothetical protein CLAFUR0_10867 [Fulvia fulva]UJO20318.1 hypothetical protein CLAFUR5_09897 [Fulvia fulva]WPV17293.1 hypothetical protein CLAFUW4_10855 [Fulvia fulva]WPV31849.1 hypothetical protein CLAFUW7_10853 [Fulvia fulva]